MRAVMLGVLLSVVPAVLALAALRPVPEVHEWVHSPTVAPPKVVEAPQWDGPASESLAKLRELTIAEAALAGPALARCETRARRRAGTERNKAFRACALRTLSRVEGSSMMNSRLLMILGDSAQDRCRERVMHLGGLTSMLGQTARETLRGALGLEWAEVLAASRSIRAFAREASKLARERGWKAACRALPERDRATADEPVA